MLVCAHAQHPGWACLLFSPKASVSLQIGEQDHHKPNVPWKAFQENKGKSEHRGCGSLLNPYWGRQFDFQRFLTSVASLKRKKLKRWEKNRRTDLYRCRCGNWCLLFLFCYQSGTLQADLPLFYGNKFSVSCDPESSHSSGQSWQQLREFALEALEESSCQSSLVKANNRAEQHDGKHKCLVFYLPKQCRDEISHQWGISMHWQIGIARIATANAACYQQERIMYPTHLPFFRRIWGCTYMRSVTCFSPVWFPLEH